MIFPSDPKGNIYMPEGDIIITSGPLIGLGDIALYSTLAKRFTELGRKVYIDKDNRARNDDALEAFWYRNPYILGETDRKPNAGYVRQGLFYTVANKFPIGSIEAMERAHGLPPPYSMAPYINYEPKPHHLDFKDSVLLDFSALSSTLSNKGIEYALNATFERWRGHQFIQIIPPKSTNHNPPKVKIASLEIDGIFEYLDLLAQARAWSGSEAGGQSLAAAARGEHDVYDLDARPEIMVTAQPRTYNSRGYTYRGVDYRVSGIDAIQEDYFVITEKSQYQYELSCAVDFAKMRALR